MREFRTYGSVRGVLGNWHPYRYRFRGSLGLARRWTWMWGFFFLSGLTLAWRWPRDERRAGKKGGKWLFFSAEIIFASCHALAK